MNGAHQYISIHRMLSLETFKFHAMCSTLFISLKKVLALQILSTAFGYYVAAAVL